MRARDVIVLGEPVLGVRLRGVHARSARVGKPAYHAFVVCTASS